MSNKSQVRSSQRTVLACTECTRRKIRCSKTIPCTACIRHNKTSTCQREPVAVVRRRATTAVTSIPEETEIPVHGFESSPGLQDVEGPVNVPLSVEAILTIPDGGGTGVPNFGPTARLPAIGAVATISGVREAPPTPAQPVSAATPDRRLTNEAASALQFLAQGRRNVLNHFVGRDSLARPPPSLGFDYGGSDIPWDVYVSIDSARVLLSLHQAHLAWMHGAVHMPTFRDEFENKILHKDCEKSWVALYYATLSHTIFHLDGSALMPALQPAFVNSLDAARGLSDKSIQALFDAHFMADHKLTSVQTICLLLQVAHNFDKSDLICILISTAIRISQCLNLHRLGPDTVGVLSPGGGGAGQVLSNQEIIDRELGKRIWWFLVRYDWFQIPFQNTCQVHPGQFNTPMPSETFDEPERMIKDGALAVQPSDVVTPSRWATSLNQVSVLVWKQQDRMQKVGFPADDKGNLSKLYEQVIWADREIKSLYASWPAWFRELSEQPVQESRDWEALPTQLMPGLVLMSTAHKILIVHRAFQLSSFRDGRFAFTQLSCIPLATRALTALQAWPDVPAAHLIRRMWTTLTFVISASVALCFALLFAAANPLTFDLAQMRRLVEFARDYIALEVASSSIARRGIRLLDALMELEKRRAGACGEMADGDVESEIGEIVRGVAAADGELDLGMGVTEAHEIVFPYGQDLWTNFLGYSVGEDLLDMPLTGG